MTKTASSESYRPMVIFCRNLVSFSSTLPRPISDDATRRAERGVGTAALRRADPTLLHTIIVDESDLFDGVKAILNDEEPPSDEVPPLTEYGKIS
ncbi:hypothetical protein [Haladaptatus sp. DYF46]|uniref:hypothetical protein n=1 Tax=Haladaptatus sp. DYF46 TaxID=2886041 RepID=UPI001E3336EA|nr:hypothetical protein [Haladaptatus sp. DYF46]